MTGRSAFRVGQGIGALVALAIVVFYAMWGDFLRLTSDLESKSVVVWMYDRDAAPGQKLEGRAWVDGESNWIDAFDVYIGDDEVGRGHFEGGKQRTVDLEFQVPPTVVPGQTLDLVIRVYSELDENVTLHRELRVYSRGTSVLRRIGKGGLALASLAAMAGLLYLVKRRALQRGKEASPLLVVPVAIAGGALFLPLTEQASRLHGTWFVGLAIAAWSAAAYWLGERWNRRIGLATFTAEQVLVEQPADSAFRGAAVVQPIKPTEDLETAWFKAGFVVRRAGGDLIITRPKYAFAIVPVPDSESFGGAPLVVRASDPDIARAVVEAAGTVLGEMRIHEDLAL